MDGWRNPFAHNSFPSGRPLALQVWRPCFGSCGGFGSLFQKHFWSFRGLNRLDFAPIAPHPKEEVFASSSPQPHPRCRVSCHMSDVSGVRMSFVSYGSALVLSCPPSLTTCGTKKTEAFTHVRVAKQISPLEQEDGTRKIGGGVGKISRRQVCGGDVAVSPREIRWPGTAEWFTRLLSFLG